MLILYLGILLLVVTLISKWKLSPELGFAVIFIIMAFQSNVQGDFITYKEFFNSLSSYTEEDEPLWIFLNKVFHPFGFFVFNLLLVTFETLVLLKLTKKYADRSYIGLAAVLFLFTNSMLIIHMKALRQVLTIEMLLIPFLLPKKQSWRQDVLTFALFVVAYFIHNASAVMLIPLVLLFLDNHYNLFEDKKVSSFIHNASAVMLIPLVLLFLDNHYNLFEDKKVSSKKSYLLPFILTGLFLIIYSLKVTLLSDNLNVLAIALQDEDFRLGSYATMRETEGKIFEVSWLIVLYDAIIVLLSAWYYNNTSGRLRIFAIMTILASVLDVLFFGMGSMMRIGYYFSIVNIVVLPNITSLISKKYDRILALIFIVFLIGYAMKTSYPFFTDPTNGRFGAYKFLFMN